jgi:RNA polymerase sigma factor (sigma-70 family)
MASPPDDPTPEKIFLDNLPLIQAIIGHSCRRALRTQDAEDFEGHVMLKLIEDDYAVIRKFRGDRGASLKTFLTITIKHMFLDYKDHLWGKYHASAKAKELGDVAIRLEMLIVREGYSFEEACEILRTNEGVEMSLAELADLRAKLPYRVPPDKGGEGTLPFLPDHGPGPDQPVLEQEREAFRRRVNMGLKRALDTLSPADHLFVKLWVKFSIAEIARSQKLEQKPLYRRMQKILKTLRKALERQGVRREDIKKHLGPLEAAYHAYFKKSNG